MQQQLPIKTPWSIYTASQIQYWEHLNNPNDDTGIYLGNPLWYNNVVEQIKFTVFKIKYFQIGAIYTDLVHRRSNITHIKMFNLFYQFITGEAKLDIELYKQATINNGLVPVRGDFNPDTYEMDEISLYVIGPFEIKLINWVNEYFLMYSHYIAAKRAFETNKSLFNPEILEEQYKEQFGRYLAFMNMFRVICYIKSVQSNQTCWTIHQYACIKHGITRGTLDENTFYSLSPEERLEIMKTATEQMEVINTCTRNTTINNHTSIMLSNGIIQCKQCTKWNVNVIDEQELCEDCYVEQKEIERNAQTNLCPNYVIDLTYSPQTLSQADIDRAAIEIYNNNKRVAARFIETNYESLRRGQYITVSMNPDGVQIVKILDDYNDVLTARVGDRSFYYTQVEPIQNRNPGHKYRRLKVDIPNSNVNNIRANMQVDETVDQIEGFIVPDYVKDHEPAKQIEEAWSEFRQTQEKLCSKCFSNADSRYKLRSQCHCNQTTSSYAHA